MNIYKTKAKSFSGTQFTDVQPKAFALFAKIKKKSKRRTYIRSVYFNKGKIFLIYIGIIYLKNLTGGIE